ncbi:hypothetical protein SAMN05421848_1340 [Kushneria avicenniae]|uniref:Uncharacterized protein n=1 Tax=Kushneria avicenniae TaxID=402385 RepID=A0A1I1J5D4_9GAMM|nr:hypothetical protein SAMN05421848_1340 [Kushneria avicenniae]
MNKKRYQNGAMDALSEPEEHFFGAPRNGLALLWCIGRAVFRPWSSFYAVFRIHFGSDVLAKNSRHNKVLWPDNKFLLMLASIWHGDCIRIR